MAILTSQKITEFYERYKGIEVTFTKEIIQVTGLMPQQVHLKCGSDFWPCVIYSSSFVGAKIVTNLKSGLPEKLRNANNSISLRYCFKKHDKINPVTFFVSARVIKQSRYGDSSDMGIMSIQFTQRSPDDLIEIMGRLLDANVNSAKRHDERVMISDESLRKLNIQTKECAVFIQAVPRRCILRDISFSGAKIIMIGIAKFLTEKEVTLRIDFEDPDEKFMIKGKIIRFEKVEGKKELIALAIQYDENVVPMGYKIRINEYLGSVRVENRTAPADKKSYPGTYNYSNPSFDMETVDPAEFSIPD